MLQIYKNVLIAWICWWWWVQSEWNDCLSCPASASGKVWPCCKEGGGWNGRPWHQVWRLGVLHPARGHLPVAHLPDCWCQVCTHGRSAEKGKRTLLNGDVTRLSPCTVSISIAFIVSPMWSCNLSINHLWTPQKWKISVLYSCCFLFQGYQRAYLIR